jgi:hypothetical protein
MTLEEWVAKHITEAPELSEEALDAVLDLYELEREPYESRSGHDNAWGLAS